MFTIYCTDSYAWEKHEQRLIDKGCWTYQENKVNSNFLRCFRFGLTNINSGHIVKVSQSSATLVGCAVNKDSRWCELHLISKTGFSALSVWIEKDFLETSHKNTVDVVLNGLVLGDLCSCSVKEWAIETDKSVFYSWGIWSDKEANPLIEAMIKANNLAIYASVPNKYKAKYRLQFSSLDLTDFKKQLSKAIHYVESAK